MNEQEQLEFYRLLEKFVEQDDMAELLMDILNGVYDVNQCIKDIKEYGRG